jgi:imidazoleglycerol phosphate synthase glutamine amidotransferase subunit HisH
MIAIIDYEIRKYLSVKNAVEKLGYKSEITNKKINQ